MANTGPSWTDSVEVVSPVALGRGGVQRGVIDLRAAFGAYLFLGVARSSTLSLTHGVNVEVRRMLTGGAIQWPGAPHFAAISDIADCYANQIDHTGGYPVGAAEFDITGDGEPAPDEDLCFLGIIPPDPELYPGLALPHLEFLRVSTFSAPTLTVDSGCNVAKIDGELFTNKANCWTVWCPGGCAYEVIFDYGAALSGDGHAVAVVCLAQTFDKLTKVM